MKCIAVSLHDLNRLKEHNVKYTLMSEVKQTQTEYRLIIGFNEILDSEQQTTLMSLLDRELNFFNLH